MSKSLKIFLAVLALISILFSLSLFFDLPKKFFQKLFRSNNETALVANNQPEKAGGGPVNIPPPALKELQAGFSLAMPFEERYLETIITKQNAPEYLLFNLESGVGLKAVFDGTIKKVFNEKKPLANSNVVFKEIWLADKEDNLTAVYYFSGLVLFKEGDKVKSGDILGEIKKQDEITPELDANFVFDILDKDNNFLKLTKGVFQK